MAYGSAFEENKPDYTATLSEFLSKYSAFLGDNKWFAGGDDVTACDFVM